MFIGYAAQGAEALIGSKGDQKQGSATGSAEGSTIVPEGSKAGPLLATASEIAAAALHTARAGVQEVSVLATNAVSLVTDREPVKRGGASSVPAVNDTMQAGAAGADTGGGGAVKEVSGRHPLQQRVCGSPAVNGCVYISLSSCEKANASIMRRIVIEYRIQ